MAVDDPGLPRLAVALDPAAMRPLLAEHLGLSPDAVAFREAPAIIKHVAGKRCTIRYDLRGGAYIGKLYRGSHRAQRVDAVLRAVSAAFSNDHDFVAVEPRLIPQLRLVLHREVEGDDVRHALLEGGWHRPIEFAARWLARLHAMPPPGVLKEQTLAHELDKLDAWCAALREYVEDAPALERIRRRLHALADELPPAEPALLHRDFYYAHVIVHGDRIAVIDFDETRAGDPAFDVAHFTAHLENLAIRRTGDHRAFEAAAAAFLAAYERERRAFDPRRLALYRAFTFCKLANTEVQRRRGDWLELAQTLTGLAVREAGTTR